jgi:hypothetical protein
MNKVNRRDALKGFMLGVAGSWGAPSALAAEREAARTQPAEQWPAVDVLVIGGGPAGIAAALMAARAGRKTLLVERYGRLGGMAVQALVGPLMGNVRSKLVDEILEHIGGRKVDYEFVDLKYAELLLTAGCQVLLHAWCAEPLLEGQRVTGARLVTKQGLIEVKAKVTVDATGDGDVAFGAGAEFAQGRGAGPNWKADGLVQPMSIMFRVAGVNHKESMDAKGGRGAYRFPDGRTWNQFCKDANAAGELPPTVGMVRTYSSLRNDERVINATQINRVDGTKVKDLTQAELEGRKQVQLIMVFLKKHAPGFQNAYVSGMPAAVGVRETRRIRGVETLAVDDLFAGRKWPDAIVREASFPIDIHNPDGIGQAQGASAAHPLGKDPKVKPYDIPYGCLVPRTVNGLLVAGRCISGSHEALASYRVQVIAMATGVAAGVAAAQAVEQGCEPRAVDVARIQAVVFAKA